MKISVVIPTHNRPALVREAVDSVIGQTHRDCEALVVDDASVPPLQEADLPRPAPGAAGAVRLIRREISGGGPSAARNAGVERASGAVVTFLDDDDLLAPHALQVIAAAFEAQPGLDCVWYCVDTFGVHAEAVRINQQQALSRLGDLYARSASTEGIGRGQVLQRPALFQALLAVLPMAFQRVALRRHLVERVGPFGGASFGDLEWYYRVALRCDGAFLNEALYHVRCDHQNEFSKPAARMKLVDSMIDARQQLLRLPDVGADPRLARSVRASLAQTHFERAFMGLESSASPVWWDLARSLRCGVAWRHVSLALRLLARRPGRA